MAAEAKSVIRLSIGAVDGNVSLVHEACPGVNATKVSALLDTLRVAVGSPWCFRGLAALTVFVGVVGQSVDVFHRSNLRALRESHAAFGLVLLLTLSSRVFQLDAVGAVLNSTESGNPRRALKTLVYLLLYVLALVKELLIVGSYLWRGGAIMDMSDDFGIYLLYGVAATAIVSMAVALRSR